MTEPKKTKTSKKVSKTGKKKNAVKKSASVKKTSDAKKTKNAAPSKAKKSVKKPAKKVSPKSVKTKKTASVKPKKTTKTKIKKSPVKAKSKVLEKPSKIKVLPDVEIKEPEKIQKPKKITEKTVPIEPKPQTVVQQPPKPAPTAEKPKPEITPKPKEEKPAKPVIKITGQPTVRELAEKMNMRVNDFIKKLMEIGIYATINQRLEPELAVLAASECGFELKAEEIYAEEDLGIGQEEEKPELLKPRPPVVTIMGHVDHGKTSLLDSIRDSKVCQGEKGAITQHIGAYKVQSGNSTIVFVDTPGHEAFTAMRSRGAQVTDIVVLVVSATDSVMPQTVEAIDHAKAAGAPIIVAINKIDLPGANPEKVKQDLAQHDLISEEWQGKTIFVEVSAKKCIKIDKLLEMISLQAEMMNLKANPDKSGSGVILESKKDPKRGNVATVLTKSGTMRVGNSFVVGSNYGKIRALIDENGKRMDFITPSVPAEMLGISGNPPEVGDMLHIVESEKKARQIADKRRLIKREENIAHQKHVTLLGLRSQIASKNLKTLQVILKADVQGSIQAIKDSLEKSSTSEVEIKIIHTGAGNINESDILLAKASDAIILGFHIGTEPKVAEEAQKEGIEIRNYDIIFELLEDVRAAMEGLLEPEIVEEVAARAKVRQKFNLSSGIIAGSMVTEGKITRGAKVRILRKNEIILKSQVSGLKRFKEDVKEVEKGYECGILINNYKDIQPEDIIEVITEKTVIRRLEAKK